MRTKLPDSPFSMLAQSACSRQVCVVLFLCALAFLARYSILVGIPPIAQPDTKSYEDLLKNNVLKNIFFQRRPAGFPLIIRLFLFNRKLIVMFQRVFSGLAWITVSLAVASRLKRPVCRWGAAISVFMFGCIPIIVWWDVHLLSESVTISVFLFIIAFVLRWDSPRNDGLLILLVAAAYYFSMLRAINVCVLPALAIYLIVLEFKERNERELYYELQARRRGVSMRMPCICLMCAGILFFWRENIVAQRWKLPLMNTLQRSVFASCPPGGREIMFNADFFMYFVRKYDMPAREAFLHLGRKRWDPPKEPTPAYDAWLSQKGYGAYMDFLMRHPGLVFYQYANIGYLYSIDGLWDIAQWNGWKKDFDYGRIIRSARIQKIYLHTAGLLVHLRYSYLIMNLLLACLIVWWNRAYANQEKALVCPEVLAALAILFYVAPVVALVAWLGDEDSPLRHSLVGMVSYYLGAIILFWAVMDWLMQRHVSRGSTRCARPIIMPHKGRPHASGSV